MVNVSALAHLFTIGTAAWAAVAMLGVALFAAWPRIMGRHNDRRKIVEEEKAGDWSRLREENARLHKYLSECEEQRTTLRDDLAAERAERARLDAIDLGQGQVRKRQATEAAYERLLAEVQRLRKLVGEEEPE